MASDIKNVFVVKVQLSILSSDGIRHMLIYDKSREIMTEMPLHSEALKLMGFDPNLLKSYWAAQMVENDDNPGTYNIQLLDQVKDEEW